MVCIRSLIALALFVLATSCRTVSPMQEKGFLDRTIKIDGVTFPYVVYVPAAFDARERWPVILFLHGAGERGNDGLRQTEFALAAAIRANPERFPAIVVMPQCPAEERWLGEPARAAMAALERTIDEFHGDRERIYLTGLSMGGYGVWHLGMEHRRSFAALVPICGGIVAQATATSVRQSPLTAGTDDPYALVANELRDTPVWIFHGADDPTIPASESQRMAEALRHAGGSDVRYTEYPGVGHNAWTAAYATEKLWTWLFAQRLKKGTGIGDQ